MTILRTAALALALAAVPGAALAKDWSGPVTAENQMSHLNALFTSAGKDCIDSKGLTDAERAPACKDALVEIAELRAAQGELGVTEKANYDFYEALMLIALGNAYSNIDKDITQRTCEPAERSWTLSYGLMSVPKDAVDKEFYRMAQNPPQSINRVLGDCRKKFGKPADASPLPNELKKK